jgi:hypothetical protein
MTVFRFEKHLAQNQDIPIKILKNYEEFIDDQNKKFIVEYGTWEDFEEKKGLLKVQIWIITLYFLLQKNH